MNTMRFVKICVPDSYRVCVQKILLRQLLFIGNDIYCNRCDSNLLVYVNWINIYKHIYDTKNNCFTKFFRFCIKYSINHSSVLSVQRCGCVVIIIAFTGGFVFNQLIKSKVE